MANLILNYFHDSVNDLNNHNPDKSSKNLRILQWNVRGVNNLEKFDSVLQFLDHCIVPVDVVILGETWLKLEHTSIYNIPGYSPYFSCRNSSNGGLVMYIQNNIKHRVIANEEYEGLHHLHVELNINGHCYDIHGVYRPPLFDSHLFCDTLERWMHLTNINHSCFIIGDVNIPINLSSNNVVMKYKNLLESYGFICTNTFPTRPSSGNLLDHVVCKIDDATLIRNDTVFSTVSDHLPIVSSLKLSSSKEPVIVTKQVTDHQELQTQFRNFINNLGPVQDANATLTNIINTYNEIFNRCTKTVSKTIKMKNSNCPWMSYDLWVLIRIKNNYLRRLKQNPLDAHLKTMLDHISKKVDKAKKMAKKQYYENLLNTTI